MSFLDFFDFTSFVDSEQSSSSSPLPSMLLPLPVSPLLNLPIELLELVVSNLSPLDLFSLIQTNTSLAYWLLQSALKKRIDEGRTLLHHVALNGPTSVMRHLLDKDLCTPLINTKDDNGSTPLHLAAEHSPDIVRLLLKKGAHINAENLARETPIFCAVEAERADIVSATASGFVDALQKMIKEGVNPFERKGCTALKVIACWRNGGLVAEDEGSGGESEGISPEILVKRKRVGWEELEEEELERDFGKRWRCNDQLR